MRRVFLSLSLLLAIFAVGCKTDGSWSEAWKDLNGENMQMRSGNSAAFKSLEQPKLQQ